MAQLLTTLGDDTIELVIREPAVPAAVDAWGRPAMTERTVTRGECSWQVTGGTEELGGTVVATLEAKGALPVDSETQALTSTAAVRHAGRLFELSTPGVVMYDGFGRASHVRVYGRYAADVSLGEAVTLVPAGRRHDGIVDPDGDPVPLIARAVIVGDARTRLGASTPGLSADADYTVVFDLDAPVNDGDWLIVRGRETVISVGRQESQWAERRQLVVAAHYRAGGRA
ncbi:MULTISPECIES: hypothetical protein [unclassified Mycobacterium]|uniref:hypothetical protein n=1 Tax=unclassified Mycobacterium TaxID=2642494 RepID=UPI0029C8607E|nr:MULTISPECIES: hypothetical protein [unclassified Mycobacterium]